MDRTWPDESSVGPPLLVDARFPVLSAESRYFFTTFLQTFLFVFCLFFATVAGGSHPDANANRVKLAVA